jgi:hypothetical protein
MLANVLWKFARPSKTCPFHEPLPSNGSKRKGRSLIRSADFNIIRESYYTKTYFFPISGKTVTFYEEIST